MINTLVPIVAVFITAVVTYIAAARRLSGRIATTEADSLWKESASIREDYRERLSAAEERQARLEERVGKLEATNLALREENIKLIQANIEKAHEIALLEERVDVLTGENNRLKSALRKIGMPDDK